MKPPMQPPGARRRNRWLLILTVVVVAAVAAWSLHGVSIEPTAVSLAQEAKLAAAGAAGSKKQINLLYTVNNLGYTTTCG